MKYVEIPKSLSCLILTAWILLPSSLVWANSAGWRAECVGRFQIGWPGEVEVALTLPVSLVKIDTIDKWRFSDSTTNLRTRDAS